MLWIYHSVTVSNKVFNYFLFVYLPVKISAPAYSPLKRGSQGPQGTGTVPGPRGRGQPLPVVTPRAPDVTVRGPGDGTSPTVSLQSKF